MVIADMGHSEKQVPGEKSMNEISTEEHSDGDICKKDNLVNDPASLQPIVKSIEQTTTDSNRSDKTAREECSQCVSEELSDVHTKSIRRPSSANVECQQLILECRVLTDLNESLRRDNEALNTVNRILQNNYDMLKERLEIVESEHRHRLSQLDNANQLLNRSLKLQTKKRSRSDEYDNYSRPLVSYIKRTKFDDERGAEDSKTVAAGDISASSKAESVEMEPDQLSTSNNSAANNDETNETEDPDRSDVKSDNLSGTDKFDDSNCNNNDTNGTDSNSDVEFIDSPAPIIIDLGDTSDDNDDYGTDEENDDETLPVIVIDDSTIADQDGVASSTRKMSVDDVDMYSGFNANAGPSSSSGDESDSESDCSGEDMPPPEKQGQKKGETPDPHQKDNTTVPVIPRGKITKRTRSKPVVPQ